MKLASVAIRRAILADVSDLERVALSASSSSIPPNCRAWLMLQGIFSYLAEDTRPFGFVTVGQPAESIFEAGTGEVLGLYVQQDYQRQGVGKKLLVHGISVLKRRRCERVVIWLPEEAEGAGALLNSSGFEANGMTRERNEDGTTERSSCYQLDITDYF